MAATLKNRSILTTDIGTFSAIDSLNAALTCPWLSFFSKYSGGCGGQRPPLRSDREAIRNQSARQPISRRKNPSGQLI